MARNVKLRCGQGLLLLREIREWSVPGLSLCLVGGHLPPCFCFFFFNFSFIFDCSGSLLLPTGFLLWCVGFSLQWLSYCGSPALELGLNSCDPRALVAQWYVGSSWTRDWTRVTCIAVNHWTTRDVSQPLPMYSSSSFCACLCPDFPFLQGHQSYWIRAHPNHVTLN